MEYHDIVIHSIDIENTVDLYHMLHDLMCYACALVLTTINVNQINQNSKERILLCCSIITIDDSLYIRSNSNESLRIMNTNTSSIFDSVITITTSHHNSTHNTSSSAS